MAGPMVTALNPGTGAQVMAPELCGKSLVGTAYTQLPVLTWMSMGQKPPSFHSLQQPVSESLGGWHSEQEHECLSLTLYIHEKSYM